jgi:hypothetical protein
LQEKKKFYLHIFRKKFFTTESEEYSNIYAYIVSHHHTTGQFCLIIDFKQKLKKKWTDSRRPNIISKLAQTGLLDFLFFMKHEIFNN